MDIYRETFTEEARELIVTLEEALLTLENNPEDRSQIQEVFRVMHSLKGGSGMFGFLKIEELTHDLETIYDLIREGKLKVTTQILDVTLKTVDHFTALLTDTECQEKNNITNHTTIIASIKEILKVIDIKNTETEEKTETVKKDTESWTTYLISVTPNKDIFKNGTNPLFLIEDLLDSGDGKAYARTSKIPRIEKLNPQECYTSWDIILSTQEDEKAIQDIFIFVDDECTVKIDKVCEYNLVKTDDLKSLETESEKTFGKTVKALAKNKKVAGQTLTETKEETLNSKIGTVSSIRVASDKLDDLMNLVSELVTSQAGLSLYSEENQDDRLEVISENIEKLSRQLRDTAFSMTLVPLDNIFYRFQRLIRDLSAQLGKSVEFNTNGGDTDLDKTIIEALTDPLMHLLRNCLDHGIESNEERKAQSKTEKGKITLNAYHSGANVHILVKDNGKGINPDIIKAKAIEKGIIEEGKELSRQEILDLLFTPGFSTATKITDVSGRGVGMDVVKRNITDLRGEVYLSSKLGKGTTVEIVLPLTLSIIDGLLVKLDETHYVIPLSAVEKCHEIEYKTLHKNFNQLIELDGAQIPFLNLRNEFSASKDTDPQFSQVIVIHNEGAKIGVCLDEIVGEYQAVLKPVGKYYSSQEYVSGATILGDGTIALVLDTYKIIDQKVKQKNLVV